MHSWSRVLKSGLRQRGCSMKSCNHPFPFSFTLPPGTAWSVALFKAFQKILAQATLPPKCIPPKGLFLIYPAMCVLQMSLNSHCRTWYKLPQIAFIALTISPRGHSLLYKGWPPTSTSPAWTNQFAFCHCWLLTQIRKMKAKSLIAALVYT